MGETESTKDGLLSASADGLEFYSDNQQKQKGMHWRTLVLLSAIISSLTSILLGYDVGVMSGAILYIKDDLDLTTTEEELVVGSLNLVAAFGGLVAGKAADMIGRKSAIGMACIIFIIGATIMTASTDFWILLIGRIITGLGVGCGFVISPVYISEITPPDMRGMLVSLTDISINFGIVLGYTSSYVITVAISDNWKWRLMLGIGIIPPILILLGLMVLPESPRWLVQKGRKQEGMMVLAKISPSPEVAAESLTSIEDAIHGENQEATWREVLFPKGKLLQRVIWIVLGLGFWQQASGSESVVYYTPTVLEEAGLTSETQLLGGTIAVGLFKLGGEVVAAFLVEKYGRRMLLMTSVILQTVSLFAIAAVLNYLDSSALDLITMCSFMW
eukprot:CAMPEP_0117754464 /NCGR_PEP_ID=MMETSP0947-20121206/12847_1 /TAXON_ID=44440 /ORGANISM="Chattonella subsalsa, Strain CCMP2191" /LENGTH=387 /DNA_ID=CAMNT_0005573563 /DNA_START=102 /DNA_END=1262 /DNA_ORIENTATION=+